MCLGLLSMVRVRYSFGSRHTGRIANIKKQRGKYPDVMKDVVRISDIVLEVLDARYVEETRNLEVEADVVKSGVARGIPSKLGTSKEVPFSSGKKLVYVLNKCDLVSRKDVEKSLSRGMRPFVFVSATKGIGVRDLKGRIVMESKRILRDWKSGKGEIGTRMNTDEHGFSKGKDDGVVKDMREAKRVHVGVIGYPNVGKSSVINMITRRGVAKTAKQAGFTKGMQKIRMSEGILILDTPGVIPASEYSTESGSFAKDVKVGARTYSDVKDPEGAVAFLMKSDADKILKFYGFEGLDVEKLIEEIGRKKGFLGKGGVVDVDRTARLILRDWQEGKIGKV